MKKLELFCIIKEAVRNALEARGYDGLEEPKEIRKARLAGRAAARQKLSGKSAEELKKAYLAVEKQAAREYQDELRHTYLHGVIEQIGDMIKKLGVDLPDKDQDKTWILQ